jgi:hypothetical protein
MPAITLGTESVDHHETLATAAPAERNEFPFSEPIPKRHQTLKHHACAGVAGSVCLIGLAQPLSIVERNE